jgi:hypothetical protein
MQQDVRQALLQQAAAGKLDMWVGPPTMPPPTMPPPPFMS